MKNIYLLFALLLCSLKILAGNGGPDSFGYTWKDIDAPGGPVFNWIDITTKPFATQVKLLGDDNSRGPFAMNFNFHYYWYDVDQFWVGSNGYIMFQDGQIASPFPAFPNTSLPNDVLGAFMNDLTFLNPNNPAACWYWVNPAHDTLIVSWVNVPFFDTNGNGYSGSNTFEVILSAVDSSITYQYNQVDPYSPYSGASSVGMEDYAAATGEGLQWPYTAVIQTPNDAFAIKFYYPHPQLITEVTDAAVLQNDNAVTGAVFISTNSSPHELTTKIRNYSTHPVNPFVVSGQVISQNGNTEVLENHYTDTLVEGETEDLNFTATFTPTETGNYKFITYAQLPGDPVMSPNNSKTQEIVAIDSSQNEIWLGYDSVIQFNGGLFSINWVGGSGGEGNYYIPPFYPVAITVLHYYISAFSFSDAFSARVFDDDGVQNLPFTLLDSIYVTGANINANGWTDIQLANPIIIDSGGFYLSWDEQSTGISLGCNNVQGHPSNRSFELFQNIWGISRYRDKYNPLIAATIEKYSVPTGIVSANKQAISLSVSPNPSTDRIQIQYTVFGNELPNKLQISSVQGKMMYTSHLANSTSTKEFNVSTWPAGVYVVKLISGAESAMQKLVISK